MRIFAYASLLIWALPISALHASEAGVVDWHKPMIGVPLTASHTTAPVFHRMDVAGGSTKSLILTATGSNVLGAIHPENGTVAWRYLFEGRDHIVSFKRYKNYVATVSGPGGATYRLLDALHGHLIHEQQLHIPESGRLFQPATLGVAIAFDHVGSDTFVLTNGHTLRRMDGGTGEVLWGWTSADQSSQVVYSNVFSTPSAVYAVGLSKSFASNTLHITALSPTTGELLADVDVPSSLKEVDDYFLLSRHGEDPKVVWLEDGKIRSIGLSPELKEKPAVTKGALYQTITNVGLGDEGQFVGIKQDGSGRVIKLADNGSLKVIWEFTDSATADHYTGSLYSGGTDKDGMPYIARVYWSHRYGRAMAHIFAAHLADGKGLVEGFTFPFETGSFGIIGHVAVDAVSPEENRVLCRLVLTTTTGTVQLWQNDQLQWTREEGLSEITVAEMVELPESKIIAQHAGVEDHETLGSRLLRQLADAQDFPQYVVNFAKRFATGSYASVSDSVAPTNGTTSLTRDTFGFRKVVVVASPHGKVYGIDSANGNVLWSRVFGLGWAAEVGGRIFPLKAFTIRTVAQGDSPQVVLVTQRKADNGLVDTVVFHIDALTGEDVSGAAGSGHVLHGHDVIAGTLVEAFLVPSDTSPYVVLFDDFLQAYVYPDTPENQEAFSKIVGTIHFPLKTGTGGPTRLGGHRIGIKKEFTGKYVAYPTWTASLPPGESVVTFVTRPHEPVASLGKVLGNRTTLYKYLNPNIVAAVTTTTPGPAKTCGVYALDGAKGSILYHAVVPAAGGGCDIKVTLTENWMVYHYYDAEAGAMDQAKSYRVVSVEFYESDKVDLKTGSSDMSSYANESTSLSVYEQSFVFPRGITAIATTSTKYGITIKDILVAGTNHRIQAFPRRFIDPRRPKRKPTADESEEWLMQYDPVLPDDPRRVLSHSYQVARIRKIITSPALLESTSLVFAYGLDMFFTRIAPSNTFDVLSENFNKIQLVLTVAGLAVAIMVTKPLVRNKKLKERWYD